MTLNERLDRSTECHPEPFDFGQDKLREGSLLRKTERFFAGRVTSNVQTSTAGRSGYELGNGSNQRWFWIFQAIDDDI